MNKIQFVSLLVVCAVASFAGSAWMNRPATPVQAQTPPVSAENHILIPQSGLRFITEAGQTVGLMRADGGSASLYLLNRNGNPSIALVAGETGEFSVSTKAGGAHMALKGPGGSSIATSVTGTQAEFSVNSSVGGAIGLSATGEGAQVGLMRANDTIGIGLTTTESSSAVSLLSDARRKAAELTAAANGGNLALSGSEGQHAVVATGSGSIGIYDGSERVWGAPPEDGE